ncbi:hypothetical protein IAT38_002720 [Cryptococcus sp. DSM 104549]
MAEHTNWAYAHYHPHAIYQPQPPHPTGPVPQWTRVHPQPQGHRTHPGPHIHPQPQQHPPPHSHPHPQQQAPQHHIQHPVHLQHLGGHADDMSAGFEEDELEPLQSVDFYNRGTTGGKSSSGGRPASGRSRSASVLSARNLNTGTPEPDAITTSLIFFPSPSDPPLQLKNARKAGLLQAPPGSILNVNDLLILHPPAKEDENGVPSAGTSGFAGHTSKWEMYTCRVCSKTYDGKNARSVARRHLQDKHGVPLSIQARRSRWDADPAKPKSKTEAKERLRKSKRDWASKNRQQGKLEKKHAAFLKRFGPNGLATSCGMRLIAPKYRETNATVSGKDKFLNGEFGGIVIPEEILQGVRAIREADSGEASDAVEGQNEEGMVEGGAENPAAFEPSAPGASSSTRPSEPAIPNSLPPSRPSTPTQLPVSALTISPDSAAHRHSAIQREYAQHHYHQQFALLNQQEAAVLQYEYYAGVPMPMPTSALGMRRAYSYGYEGQQQMRVYQPRPVRVHYNVQPTAEGLEAQQQHQQEQQPEAKPEEVVYNEPEPLIQQPDSAQDAPPLTASSVTEVAATTPPEDWTRSEHWKDEVKPEDVPAQEGVEGREREEEAKLEPAHEIEKGWQELGWESSDKEEGGRPSAEPASDSDNAQAGAVEKVAEGGKLEKEPESETESSGDIDIEAAAESLLNLHSTPLRAPEDSPTATIARREKAARAAPAPLPWSSGMMDAPPLSSVGRSRSYASGASRGGGDESGSSGNKGSAGRPSRTRSFIQPFRDPRPEVTRSLSFEHSPVLDDPFVFGETPERPTGGSAYSATRARSSGAGSAAGKGLGLRAEGEAGGSGTRRSARRGMGLPSPSPLSSSVYKKRKTPPSSPATHPSSSTAVFTSASSRWDSSAFGTSPHPSSALRPALRPLSTNFHNSTSSSGANANGKMLTPSKSIFDTPVRSARTPMVPSSITKGWLMSSPGGDAAASLGLVPTHLAPATPGLRGIVGADTPGEGGLAEARKRRRGVGV